MRNIRIDTNGEFRCWKCGGKSLLAKRTLRAKVAFGVGALLTKKKLKCQTCGEYNDSGHAKPYNGPASRKLGRRYKTFTAMHGARDGTELEDDDPTEGQPDDDPDPSGWAPPMASEPPPPPPPAPVVPANWYPDPRGRHELRYHDGTRWTNHVSTNGEQSADPL